MKNKIFNYKDFSKKIIFFNTYNLIPELILKVTSLVITRLNKITNKFLNEIKINLTYLPCCSFKLQKI